MVRKKEVLRNKAEVYLETIEEARNLFEALDFPPSRLRAILIRTFMEDNQSLKETSLEKLFIQKLQR